MFRKFIFLIVFCSLQYSIIYSQTPSYYHYTSSDGLASSTVFDVIQDKDGFIWFGTLNGLSRFDGKHFTNFSTNNGLNSNVITYLVEGDNGEIYIANYEKGLNVLINDTIKNYVDKINGVNFNTSYMLNHSGKLYAYTRAGGINIIKRNSPSNLSIDYVGLPIRNFLLRLAKLPSDSLAVLTTRGLYKLDKQKLLKMNIKDLPEGNLYSLAARDDGSYFIGASGCLYQIMKNRVIKKFTIRNNNKPFHDVYCDKKNNVWVSVLGSGFFVILSGSDKIIDLGKNMGLENTQIDDFFEDSEGNIWICTFGKGVYCLNNLYLTNYTEKDGLTNNNIICMNKDNEGRLFLGTIDGISILDNEKIDVLKENSGKPLTGYVNGIYKFIDDNDLYICYAPESSFITKTSYKGINIHLARNPSLYKSSNGIFVYGGVGNELHFLKNFQADFHENNYFFLFGDIVNQNRINALYVDKKNNIWVGTSKGLCKISGVASISNREGWGKYFFPKDPVLNSKINSIYCDNKNRVWFTGVKGVACYNLNNDSISSFTSILGHKLSTPTSVAVDNKGRMWIGTMKGLYLNENNSVKFLDSQTGLPSNEILSLLFDNRTNLLYIGTSNGLSKLNVTAFDNYSHPPLDVKINSIQAGDSIFTNNNNLIFNPNQNNVYIKYRVINYSSPGSVSYKYILNGDSRETKNDFLDFSSLDHGIYNLQIMARTPNTDWGKPSFITFRVLPRFVETFWFDLLIVSLILFVAALILYWRLKLNKKKNAEQLELTERINDLKHQALSAMMNPHFVFNSLNSVQYLVNSDKLEEANDYIAMMAKLMRKNLDTAGSGFILLSEEINRLKLYLDLEKLRFQESFSYDIITEADVDANSILMPNMIIQPFVENSLWHGIIDTGIKGTLTISFSFENVDIDSVICKSLIIKVTDNGIGIKEAKKNKKEDHISKGIQIIEERLSLLSAKMKLPQPIMFEDLGSREDNSHGTEVIISLPLPLYKILTHVSNPISAVTD